MVIITDLKKKEGIMKKIDKINKLKECKFSDHGINCGREYICCTAIPPLLGSGVLCPIFIILHQEVNKSEDKNFFFQQKHSIPKCCLSQYRRIIY
ncbi:hypothetical protein COS33_01565 [Candidatus Wolfebacteria bacterium CG02_land_8_20_14_3_00_37_12]|uniref:Uncharacterized protein n=1 Tax=Candidatus Wolfebacteria bacterium CG02_land_8_20_14_3_00_37_12 TaxID=1975066 RepID=A0A2M7CQ49_9BACT|nr:MAG: hypothetical protein COS33_01565 [Candidatus Wolfebacteria bacterium CG02_land_8_20_14_3_00_37_12]